jgi:hypothetical protein
MRSFARQLVVALAVTVSACGGGSDANKPPTAAAVNLVTTEDAAVAGSFAASDPDGDSLSARIASPATKGDVVISSNGSLAFVYTPRADQNGSDSFTYVVNDGRADSAAATVTVGIAAANDPPRIQPSIATDEDAPITAQLVAEPDGEAFTFQVLVTPTHGALSADPAAPGRVTYTPDANFNGADSFQVQAQDALATAATQVVQVQVGPVNDSPVSGADAARTVQGRPVRVDVLSNDSDIDGDALAISVTGASSAGVAAVNQDGSIQFTPNDSFIGTTQLTYEARDATGAAASAVVSIDVTLTSGILFLSSAVVQPPRSLYFSDGVRTAAIGAPLSPGENIISVLPAKTAPVVFYLTNDNTIRRLFRVDLRHPDQVRQLDNPTAWPGIQDFAINADGSKVAYQFAGRLYFVDFATPEVTRDLAAAPDTQLFMNASGTRLFYTGLFTPLYFYAGALFSLDTSGGASEQQITPTVAAPSSTSGVTYLSRDESQLYYSVSEGLTSRLMAVDPNVSGSQFVVLESTTVKMGISGFIRDESAFWGRSLDTREDYYLVRVGNPGTPTNLTGDTPNGGLLYVGMTDDGASFFYTRSIGARSSTLYRVNTSTPVSTPISTVPPSYYGIGSLSVAHGGQNLVYTTMDLVPLAGGGSAPGLADVYFLDLANAGSPVILRHFGGAATVRLHAPDDSFCVVTANDAPSDGFRKGYVVNLRNPEQIIRIGDNVFEAPMVVPNPLSVDAN